MAYNHKLSKIVCNKIELIDKKYYNINFIKNYKRPLKLIFGSGGIGKSFSCLNDVCVSDAIKSNGKDGFIWYVKDDETLATMVDNQYPLLIQDCSILRDANVNYLDVYNDNNFKTLKKLLIKINSKQPLNDNDLIDKIEFDIDNKNYCWFDKTRLWYNGFIIGHVLNVNQAQRYQGRRIPNIKNIVVDEFFKIDNNHNMRQQQLLSNLANFYETIKRTDDGNIYLISNFTATGHLFDKFIDFANVNVGDVIEWGIQDVDNTILNIGVCHIVGASNILKDIQKKSLSYALNVASGSKRFETKPPKSLTQGVIL